VPWAEIGWALRNWRLRISILECGLSISVELRAALDMGPLIRLRTRMPKRLAMLLLCLLAPVASAQDEEEKPSLSPDKKWAFRFVEEQPAIVRAESGEVVLKLQGEDSALTAETGKVLWAPDSRRLAFNYRAGGRYYTCAVYELAGSEWKVLPDLESNTPQVEKIIARAEQRDRKRLGVTKTAYRRRISDEWRVRRWIDVDSFEALAISSGSVIVDKKTEDVDYIGGAVLLTVKCDNKGGWKIARLRELSDADLEKLSKETEE